jgi:hypothetical protein
MSPGVAPRSFQGAGFDFSSIFLPHPFPSSFSAFRFLIPAVQPQKLQGGARAKNGKKQDAALKGRRYKIFGEKAGGV